MSDKLPVTYPQGADRQLLQKGEQEYAMLRQKAMENQHAEFVAGCNDNAKWSAILNEDILLKTDGLRKEHDAALERLKKRLAQPPPANIPLKGHNPARFAPYDFSGSSRTGGGAQVATMNGPNAATGTIGGSLAAYPPGAQLTQFTDVYFWYFAPRPLTLLVTVQVSAYAQWELAVPPFGYARSHLGLQALITQWGGSWQSAMTENTIFDQGANVAFILRQGRSGEIFTASVAMPVLGGTWYLITARAMQQVWSGLVGIAEATFYANVGPVIFSEH